MSKCRENSRNLLTSTLPTSHPDEVEGRCQGCSSVVHKLTSKNGREFSCTPRTNYKSFQALARSQNSDENDVHALNMINPFLFLFLSDCMNWSNGPRLVGTGEGAATTRHAVMPLHTLLATLVCIDQNPPHPMPSLPFSAFWRQNMATLTCIGKDRSLPCQT